MTARLLARILPLALVLLAFLSPRASAQQSGGIIFEVTEASGTPIKGVGVTLSGDNLLGSQYRETDEHGRASFLGLIPGKALADFQAKGYLGLQRDVSIGLGEHPLERVVLAKGELTESVKVTAQKPIDPTQTNTSYQYDANFIKNVQIGSGSRSYQSVAGLASGVVGGGGDPAIRGATIGENRYTIDGVDTTDPVTGTFGLNANIDTVQQVELQTGGFEPEYGLATGGIVNQVTKSGGNEVHGTADLRYTNVDMVSKSHLHQSLPQTQRQFDFTIGGPIKKDKLWYFFGFSDNLFKNTPDQTPYSRQFKGRFYLAKFTWQIDPKNRISFQYEGDPTNIDNSNAGQFVAPEAASFQKQGATFVAVNYNGTINKHWVLAASAGSYSSVLNTVPEKDTGLPSLQAYFDGYLSQNYNDSQKTNRYSQQFKMDAEYISDNAHPHDVKFGWQSQWNSFSRDQVDPGGENDLWVGDQQTWDSGGFDPSLIYERDVFTPAGVVKSTQQIQSLFGQDRWQASKHTTVLYGLRWDISQLENDDKSLIADMRLLQPRFGIVQDINGDGKDVLRFSIARYMHPSILTIANAVAAHASMTTVYRNERYFGDLNGDGDNTDGLVLFTSYGGPGGSVVAPNLRATHNDEVTVGYKHLIDARQIFGVNLTYRRTRDIVEDASDPSTGVYVIQNFPGLRRDYKDIEFEYGWNTKKTHLFGNVTIASAKGNVEYDQGLGPDFDFPELGANRYGYLSTDRRVRLKLYGWRDLPKQWSVSWNYFLGTGAPYNRLYDASQDGLYDYYYIDPRGSHRLRTRTQLDTEIRKHWNLGRDEKNPRTLTLIGSITNVFHSNTPTSVQQLDPNKTANLPCGAPDPDLDGDGIPDSDGHWCDVTGYQAPRQLEFGLRFEW